ncbi:MAG TPA: FAD-binding monooxygenase [Steroidobacteraceae bacterium]|nr:FAD-binding monooxygenase [Steroidobacteraceae bacterium]
MQFYLNGFRPGDPEIAAPVEQHEASRTGDALPAEVDVLIIGSGPAGLTLATQLAAFPDITTRIVEQKPGPLLLGQADGIACRTMEMFEAFGFSERVLKEAYWVNETTFWKPDDNHRGNIIRSSRIQDTEDGLSEFPHVILNQARVHDFYLTVMRNSPTRLTPDYARCLLDLSISPAAATGAGEPGGRHDSTAYPVTARFERLDPEHRGQVEVVKARFVVGCDGAHSTVRKSLGRVLQGDWANQAWGVMDVLAVTDFPDIRLKTAIHSASEGSMLIIPREGGYLVRLYIELDKLSENERVASRNITADHLIAAARRILHPYTLEVKEIAWWSVYEIGQRLCDKFDDVPEQDTAKRTPRVFIAGDACHTHSPKAGQGMNVSMQDAFNLGWKLVSVLRGRCSPRVLDTYSAERHGIAKELIDFDRRLARMFSAAPKDPADANSEGIDPAEFQKYFVMQLRFTAGTATRYRPSILCGEPTWQHLAKGLPIGMRLHSAPVIRLADAKALQLGHTVKADGRWRLFLFADEANPAAAASRARALCEFLAESPQSPIRRYTPRDADPDCVIDVRAIFQQGHRELALEAMPALLLPRKGPYGLHDYEKMFCPDLHRGHDIFDLRGIDRDRGCAVIVRPDQYVAHVLPLEAHTQIAAFFDGFLLRQA